MLGGETMVVYYYSGAGFSGYLWPVFHSISDGVSRVETMLLQKLGTPITQVNLQHTVSETFKKNGVKRRKEAVDLHYAQGECFVFVTIRNILHKHSLEHPFSRMWPRWFHSRGATLFSSDPRFIRYSAQWVFRLTQQSFFLIHNISVQQIFQRIFWYLFLKSHR